MPSPPMGLSRLKPAHWPVRWRVAATSAILTFLILLAFALIVGRLLTNQIRDSFYDELRGSAGQVASAIRITPDLSGTPHLTAPNLGQVAIANSVWVRVVAVDGTVYGGTSRAPRSAVSPHAGVTTQGTVAVATEPVGTISNLPPMFVQYARSTSNESNTVDRVWLLLGAGVLTGTLFAGIAGIRVARRAMAPIAGLTATATAIARTGDPGQRIAVPGTSDEIAELARTLDGMLQALDAAREEREGMITWQREFVADVSHELRTPLTSTLANLELLYDMLARQEGPEADEQQEIVESALRSSARMKGLVGDLIVLARADAKKMSVRKPCDLSEVAAAAVDEATAVARDRTIEFTGSHDLVVHGNPDELHRMIVNLVDNAIRHTPTGTNVEVSLTGTDGTANVEVCDDGPGVDPEMRERIFERFVHGEGPADQSTGGVGLGLAIVRSVAESHGGTARVGDAASGGARFVVSLPLASGDPVAPHLRLAQDLNDWLPSTIRDGSGSEPGRV